MGISGAGERRPLLSRTERRVAERLGEIIGREGFRIFSQVKLSSAVDPLPTGLTREQWNYATRATFDFVVCDDETRPQFAIELDGLSHLTPEAQRRDRLKEQVCDAAELELLRIESSSVDPGPRGRNVVEYLMDARAMFDAFVQAQEAGTVPWDEPYDYRSFVGPHPSGFDFVNELGGESRRAAFRAQREGQIASFVIQGIHFSWKSGNAEGWAWLRTGDDRFLFARTVIRSYRFRCGLGPGELAEDLSTAAIGDQLAAYLRGEAVLVSASELARQLDAVRQRRGDIHDSYLIDHVMFVD